MLYAETPNICDDCMGLFRPGAFIADDTNLTLQRVIRIAAKALLGGQISRVAARSLTAPTIEPISHAASTPMLHLTDAFD